MNRFFILIFLAITLIACNKDEFIPTAELNKQALQFGKDGGTESFAITSNAEWIIGKDADWLTLSKESGSGDATIEVIAAANTNPVSRTTSITVKIAGLPDVVIEVAQDKALETVGLFILSEGYYGSNTSDIAYYDFKTATLTKNYFSARNGGPLGDGANDLAIYGSKLYCVVSGTSASGYIEVINPETGVSIKRITLDEAGAISVPRRLTFYENKAYITTYSNNVVRLDTATLAIDGKATLSGTYAEGICQYNGNLYVCNSGQGSGTTISVVNISRFSETETITVPQNPVMIKATASGEIYFSTADLSWSSGETSNLHLLNPEQKKVTQTFDVRASGIALGNDFLYAVDFDWNDYSDHISKINLQTKAVSNITSIYEDYAMVYTVSVNPLTNDVYLGNQGDDVVVFDKDDNKKLDLKIGIPVTSTVVPIIK